jgi:hypothetical protein
VLIVFLSADDGTSLDDLTVIETAIENELRVLGIANRLLTVETAGIPSECMEGVVIRIERFLLPALDTLLACALRNDLVLTEQTNRFVLMVVTPKRIRSDDGELFGGTPWVHSERTWVSLLSTAWLSGETGVRRERLIQRLVQHELGHALGLVPEGRVDSEELYGTHCMRVCIMHQGVSVHEFWELAQAEDRQGVLFCELCRNNLRELTLEYSPTFRAES